MATCCVREGRTGHSAAFATASATESGTRCRGTTLTKRSAQRRFDRVRGSGAPAIGYGTRKAAHGLGRLRTVGGMIGCGARAAGVMATRLRGGVVRATAAGFGSAATRAVRTGSAR